MSVHCWIKLYEKNKRIRPDITNGDVFQQCRGWFTYKSTETPQKQESFNPLHAGDACMRHGSEVTAKKTLSWPYTSSNSLFSFTNASKHMVLQFYITNTSHFCVKRSLWPSENQTWQSRVIEIDQRAFITLFFFASQCFENFRIAGDTFLSMYAKERV